MYYRRIYYLCKLARQCYAIFWLNWLVNKYICRVLTYKYWKLSRTEVNYINLFSEIWETLKFLVTLENDAYNILTQWIYGHILHISILHGIIAYLGKYVPSNNKGIWIFLHICDTYVSNLDYHGLWFYDHWYIF